MKQTSENTRSEKEEYFHHPEVTVMSVVMMTNVTLVLMTADTAGHPRLCSALHIDFLIKPLQHPRRLSTVYPWICFLCNQIQ